MRLAAVAACLGSAPSPRCHGQSLRARGCAASQSAARCRCLGAGQQRRRAVVPTSLAGLTCAHGASRPRRETPSGSRRGSGAAACGLGTSCRRAGVIRSGALAPLPGCGSDYGCFEYGCGCGCGCGPWIARRLTPKPPRRRPQSRGTSRQSRSTTHRPLPGRQSPHLRARMSPSSWRPLPHQSRGGRMRGGRSPEQSPRRLLGLSRRLGCRPQRHQRGRCLPPWADCRRPAEERPPKRARRPLMSCRFGRPCRSHLVGACP